MVNYLNMLLKRKSTVGLLRFIAMLWQMKETGTDIDEHEKRVPGEKFVAETRVFHYYITPLHKGTVGELYDN